MRLEQPRVQQWILSGAERILRTGSALRRTAGAMKFGPYAHSSIVVAVCIGLPFEERVCEQYGEMTESQHL